MRVRRMPEAHQGAGHDEEVVVEGGSPRADRQPGERVQQRDEHGARRPADGSTKMTRAPGETDDPESAVEDSQDAKDQGHDDEPTMPFDTLLTRVG